ncbi:MAG TPA: amidase [Solirubrobacteraceae bacterium]|nr:amidase [Solirubrobacteraceae bacterium]
MALIGSGDGLLGGIDAVTLRERLHRRELACSEVAATFLEAVGNDPLHAWQVIDGDALLAQAAALDGLTRARREELLLFGVPVGIKDNFDTADLPTAYGSPIYLGHRPAADAEAVQRLRDAGALIAGKTKCAEFAWMFPSDTLNPLCPGRTPGGSSNGSAAAVAAGIVPLATGTQTAGSINRPASYCAVLGYKPTLGVIPRDGIKLLAGSLDTAGLFARSVADLELAGSVLAGGELPRGGRHQAGGPRIGFARSSMWDRVEPAAQAAIDTAVERIRGAGAAIDEIELPSAFDELSAAQTTVQFYEAAVSLAAEARSSPSRLSRPLREALEEGARIEPARYETAKRAAVSNAPALVGILGRFDGVLAPSATGVPPLRLDFTGDPLFCRAWTLIGAPCVSLPLAWTADGLPVGLQLVGAPGSDTGTLAAAQRLVQFAS